MAAIDPGQERLDDYTGPPVTAAEVAALEKLVMVLGGLAVDAGEEAQAAYARDENGTPARGAAGPASRGAAEKSFDQLSRRAERLARAMRVTLAQKVRLVMELHRWRQRNARSAKAAEAACKAEARERQQAQAADAAAIVDEIVRHDGGAAAAKAARQPVERWLAERDYAAHLAKLSVGEMVARICRDLGQDVNWRHWQGRPWAADAEAFFGREAAEEAAEPETAGAEPAQAPTGAPREAAATPTEAVPAETTPDLSAPPQAPASEPAAQRADAADDPQPGDPGVRDLPRGDSPRGKRSPTDPPPPDPLNPVDKRTPAMRRHWAEHGRRCPITGRWQFRDPLTNTWT